MSEGVLRVCKLISKIAFEMIYGEERGFGEASKKVKILKNWERCNLFFVITYFSWWLCRGGVPTLKVRKLESALLIKSCNDLLSGVSILRDFEKR